MSDKSVATAGQSLLILTFEHPEAVTDSFAYGLASAALAFGWSASVLTLPRDLEQIQTIGRQTLAGVISIGPWPLQMACAGRAVRAVFDCPVWLYFLDSPIYDLARLPMARSFLEQACADPALVPVFAENSYRQILLPSLPPQTAYIPFAGFPSLGRAGVNHRPAVQDRLLVVGTVGREIGSVASGDLPNWLAQTLPSLGASSAEIDALTQSLMGPHLRGNICIEVAKHLQWQGAWWQVPAALRWVCQLDSRVKRERRLRAIRSLAGQRVDFVGQGWDAFLSDVPSFRFVGTVGHDHLARLADEYLGLVNFDPNWEWGVHDRVFTATSMGVPLITNENRALQEEGLPASLVHTFSWETLDLRAAADAVRSSPRSQLHEREVPTYVRNCWTERLGRFWACIPAGWEAEESRESRMASTASSKNLHLDLSVEGMP